MNHRFPISIIAVQLYPMYYIPYCDEKQQSAP